ncbi:hypothetical protein O7606_19115 [Micromonospora sp. WMMD882]|uniref:hypothetical protein n=1 Tax=Micromonospora sp. WMMD882 TaxID=3015151 RepID=UPI00248B3558|nr:hypothetical protein [Micromonospora sp. WMMD882]WBB78325.1 hypothetical protein O7606_19115 [Micromonospora sp. WMMD882]
MTAGRFREVDLDLLADYVGGALTGTPDEATVARLVAEDTAWARAYAELAPAVGRVGLDLAAWGEPAEQMPGPVADRLAAALAGAGPAVPAITVPTQPAGAAARRLAVIGGSDPVDATVGPAGRGTPGAGRPRRSRRWSGQAGRVLVAAAAVAVAGFGVTQFLSAAQNGAADGGQPPGSAREDSAASGEFRLTTQPERTGVSYTPESLAGAPAGPGVLRESSGPDNAASEGAAPRRPLPLAGLERLSAREALDDCLTEVGAAHGAGPITVDRLEYAAFQGEPALVVGLLDAAGERWIVVAGAGCGAPGSGADTRYRTRVG